VVYLKNPVLLSFLSSIPKSLLYSILTYFWNREGIFVFRIGGGILPIYLYPLKKAPFCKGFFKLPPNDEKIH
jgi:hypothetical protein